MQLSLLPKIPNAADLVVNNLIVDLRLLMDLYIDSHSIEAGLGMEGVRLTLFHVHPWYIRAEKVVSTAHL
jgi:hypothetical protein